MASSVIHLAVAEELNKKLKREKKAFLIGSIAPDISKLVNDSREKSHFIDNKEGIPNIDKFLDKYRDKLDDEFVLGYYIHLYTDYIWFKYFVPEVFNQESEEITKLDGTVVKCNGNMMSLYIYNDYTNLNIQLIDEYNLDLSIFYEGIPKLNNIIEEIPMDKINVIVDKAGVIVENTKVHKELVFNIFNIKKFIETSVGLILLNLDELGIL